MVLSEISLTQKDKYFPPTQGGQKKSGSQRQRQVLEEGESEESVFRGHQVPAGRMGKFCRWMVAMAAQQCEWTYCRATNDAF